MLQCTIKFHADFHTKFQDDISIDALSEKQSQLCFVSTANYQLAFFDDQKSQEPFYEINIGEFSPKSDSNTNSITISHKKANHPLFTIYSAPSVLNKIQQAFQEYSDDKVAWNLLIDTPYHRPKDSYLTNVNRDSNSEGIITLIIMIAFFAKIRDVINNHLAYGLLPMPESGPSELYLIIYAATCFILTTAFMIGIEKLAFKEVISNKTAVLLEALNILQAYILPVYFCSTYQPYYLLSMFYTILTLGVILKIMSYTHLMYELRSSLPGILNTKASKDLLKLQASRENIAVIQKHAANLSELVNLKDILHFFFAPTLVYQLWYPRTEQVNKKRAIRLGIELLLVLVLQQYWQNQHVIPVMKTSTEAFQTGTFAVKTEKFLDAMTTYLINLVLSSYLYFHVLANFLGEILRLSNRDFYDDWWNNTSIRSFWNHWNLPVHRWCMRHIYKPIQKLGYSKFVATCAVFLFSGIMHEYIYCVPAGFVSYYAILVLFMQAPIMFLEERFSKVFKKLHLGNIYMWGGFWGASFVYGAIMYRIKYLELNEGKTNAIV